MKIQQINDWWLIESKVTKSTNDDALNFELPKNDNKKFAFSAERQTGGRGRLGRKWNDGEGNLMLSSIVTCSNEDVGRLALISGICVLQAIKFFAGTVDVKLKWPNDVLLNNKKVCGILLERKDEKNMVVGIGVNIKNAPMLSNCTYQATSLKENDIFVEKYEFLRRFFEIFDEWLEKIEKREFNEIQNFWNANAKGINEQIEIRNVKENILGRLIGVDENGALLLEKDGKASSIVAGDICYL